MKDKNIKLSNLKNKYFDVTNDSVHALEKPLYNSFFCSKKMPKNQKEKQIGESKQCRESEERGIDDDFETREIKFRVKIKLETQTHMKTKIKATLKIRNLIKLLNRLKKWLVSLNKPTAPVN